jgi:hypothetical protein
MIGGEPYTLGLFDTAGIYIFLYLIIFLYGLNNYLILPIGKLSVRYKGLHWLSSTSFN